MINPLQKGKADRYDAHIRVHSVTVSLDGGDSILIHRPRGDDRGGGKED